VTVLLNRIRDFYSNLARRSEVCGGAVVNDRLQEEPSSADVEEWDRERQRHLFHGAAQRVQSRTSALHWDVFVRTALDNRPAQEVAGALSLSLTNVYAIKSRVMREIKDEIERLEVS
jgi:RNA polymerase sigma-70 factor (ECF subfamily)